MGADAAFKPQGIELEEEYKESEKAIWNFKIKKLNSGFIWKIIWVFITSSLIKRTCFLFKKIFWKND